MQPVRSQRAECVALADLYSVRVSFETTRRGHVRAVFVFRHRKAAIIMARGHGGDWRARLNNLRLIRRKLRELTT